MKKTIIAALLALFCAWAAPAREADEAVAATSEEYSEIDAAQEAKMQKRIWGKGRFTRLGYANAQTCADNSSVEKGQYGFFLTKGTTYLFPKKAFAGLVKVGFDVVWFDMQFSKYKDPYASGEWTSEFESIYDDYDDDDDFNIGRMALNIGMGIGPNVSVAPFALTSIKHLRPLRASLYFHYAPTASLYMMSQGGETELSTAFCSMWRFGGTLRYRGIALGMEGLWGSGKYKPFDFEDVVDNVGSGVGASKYTRKFANMRFYIQFSI